MQPRELTTHSDSEGDDEDSEYGDTGPNSTQTRNQCYLTCLFLNRSLPTTTLLSSRNLQNKKEVIVISSDMGTASDLFAHAIKPKEVTGDEIDDQDYSAEWPERCRRDGIEPDTFPPASSADHFAESDSVPENLHVQIFRDQDEYGGKFAEFADGVEVLTWCDTTCQ
ncbi:hypothetical protein BDW69DRAFT_190110 [Aspergillus filifer]